MRKNKSTEDSLGSDATGQVVEPLAINLWSSERVIG